MAGTERVECSQCGKLHAPTEPCPGASDPLVGMVIAGKYSLVRLLGHGGMGSVYEARHTSINRRFAVKFLLRELATNPEILRRFENEAKAAGSLEHPNLAAVTDFGRLDDDTPFIVMEYLQGEDCSRLLSRTGPLPVARAVDVVVQACRGLAVAHDNGIVHRDLKPENLFLAKAGDGTDHVKVLDFGIAKLKTLGAESSTTTGQTMGTAFYMSPEQARGDRDIDERTDVYSMGVVLFELLAGERPVQGDSFLQVVYQILQGEPKQLAAIRPGVPDALHAAIRRAMAKDASQRFASIRDLAQAIAPYGPRGAAISMEPATTSDLAMHATVATPATGIRAPSAPTVQAFVKPSEPTEIPGLPAKRGRTPLVAGAIAALAVVAIGAVALMRGGGSPEPSRAPAAIAPTAIAETATPARSAPIDMAPPTATATPTIAAPSPAVSAAPLRSTEPPSNSPPRATVPARLAPGAKVAIGSTAPAATTAQPVVAPPPAPTAPVSAPATPAPAKTSHGVGIDYSNPFETK